MPPVLAHRPSRWGVRCAMTSAGVTGDKRTALAGLARWGLASRGVIYLLMAALAGALAAGRSNKETDQHGALEALAGHLGGAALLGLLAGGFGGYALWRFSEAAFGVRSDPGTFPRVRSALRGVAYAGLAATTTLILTGSGGGGSQAQQQQSLTARAMAHTGGRVLVTLIGLVIVGAGLAMAAEGITKSFEKHLRMAQMSPNTRRIVVGLGVIGSVTRGVVVMLAGALAADAAVTFDPTKARGLDAALRTLADQPDGAVLLAAAALGLAIFGVFGLAEARWGKT